MEIPELLTLDLDLSETAHHRSFVFQARINPKPLAVLAAHARCAHRVYELMLISRPGDLLDYLTVDTRQVPERIAKCVIKRRQELAVDRRAEAMGFGDHVSLRTFDAFFCDFADDRDPVDDAWYAARDSVQFKRYLRSLLRQVREIQRSLKTCEPIVQHELALISRGKHPYIFFDRTSALTNGRHGAPLADAYPEGFYQKVAELITRPDLSTISYRGEGDHRLFRMLCAEQLRRAALPRASTEQRALKLHALTDAFINCEPWGAQVYIHGEGIGRPELFIDDGTYGGSVKKVVEGPGSLSLISTHTIISTVDAGELRNCTRQAGDGWTLYLHQSSWKKTS